MSIVAAEYSGVVTSSPLDQTGSSADQTVTTPVTGTTSTTSQADELVVGGIGYDTGPTPPTPSAYSGPTNGFSLVAQDETGSAGCCYLDKIVSATGTYSSGATIPSFYTTNGAIATFKAAAGGGGTVPAAPTVLVVYQKTDSSNQLYWTNDPSAVGTDSRVRYCTNDPNFASGGITTIDIGSVARSYVVTGLTPGTWYYFQVAEQDATGWSDWSNTAIGYAGNFYTFIPISDIADTGWSAASPGGRGAVNMSATLAWISNPFDPLVQSYYVTSPTNDTEQLEVYMGVQTGTSNPPGNESLPSDFGEALAFCYLLLYKTASSPVTAVLNFLDSGGSSMYGDTPSDATAGPIYHSANAAATPGHGAAALALPMLILENAEASPYPAIEVYQVAVVVAYESVADIGDVFEMSSQEDEVSLFDRGFELVDE